MGYLTTDRDPRTASSLRSSVAASRPLPVPYRWRCGERRPGTLMEETMKCHLHTGDHQVIRHVVARFVTCEGESHRARLDEQLLSRNACVAAAQAGWVDSVLPGPDRMLSGWHASVPHRRSRILMPLLRRACPRVEASQALSCVQARVAAVSELDTL